MVILDYPYASKPLVDWLIQTKHPVLKNDFTEELAASGSDLNLVNDVEAATIVRSGDRIYTNSENALEWLAKNAPEAAINEPIKIFKDKARTRQLLAPLSPSLFYETYSRDELASVDASKLPLPVVLKPSVGFCSMGVYTIESPQDWEAALKDIAQNEAVWNERYPESVVDSGEYIVEGYITGPEYAIDMYYDAQGTPHILNILRHDFIDAEDTSDRMYVTSEEIAHEMLPVFQKWLTDVNAIIGAKDFPAHVEVRVQDGQVIPIEFNPMRFAGLGGTDVAHYGFGLRTYEAYLEDKSVDLLELLSKHPGKVYSMSLLNPSPEADLSKPFDYDEFLSRFSKVLGFNRFDVNKVGSYGFLFLETDGSTAGELDYLLKTDLLEFI